MLLAYVSQKILFLPNAKQFEDSAMRFMAQCSEPLLAKVAAAIEGVLVIVVTVSSKALHIRPRSILRNLPSNLPFHETMLEICFPQDAKTKSCHCQDTNFIPTIAIPLLRCFRPVTTPPRTPDTTREKTDDCCTVQSTSCISSPPRTARGNPMYNCCPVQVWLIGCA